MQTKTFVGGVDEIIDQSNARTSLSVFDDFGRHEECQSIEPLNVCFETEGQLLIVNNTIRNTRMSTSLFRREFHDEILNQFFSTDRFQSILKKNNQNHLSLSFGTDLPVRCESIVEQRRSVLDIRS